MLDLASLPPKAFAGGLEYNLERLGTLPKVYDHFLSSVCSHLKGDTAWLRRSQRESEHVVEDYAVGSSAPRQREESLITAFLQQERPRFPRSLLLSPLRVHGRTVGIVGCERHGSDFERGRGWALNRLASILARDLSRREEERLTRVLGSIREKVLAELRPRDLAYQILDGLYELVHYDHSAALLIYEPERHSLRVEADKISWTKAKSAHVGHEVQLSSEAEEVLTYPSPMLTYPAAEEERGRASDLIFDLLYFHRGDTIPEPRSILCAPLYFDGDLLGLLKIAARSRLPFDARDREVTERFLPAAAVALRNARERASLQDQALQAEIRAGLVTLARAVAHDVNNAIGSLLPLAEQVRDDLRSGRSEVLTLVEDMDVIIDKAALCKRIFGNMLRAGTEKPGREPIDPRAVIEELFPLLNDYVEARRSRLRLDLELESGSRIRFSKAHLERILWNLVTNAADALSASGGTVVLRTELGSDGRPQIAVIDDGPGIPDELLDKVMEPFFSTKKGGTGLGLSICRALAWQYGGTLRIEGLAGHGTRAILSLPLESRDE
jgi:two-component system, NtrC family, sensor kinase